MKLAALALPAILLAAGLITAGLVSKDLIPADLIASGSALGSGPGHDERRAPRPALVASERAFLGEWLDFERARCRVADARRVLTEARQTRPEGTARRVAPDVYAIDLSLECEDKRGEPLRLDEALPGDASLSLDDASGNRRAPSLRTLLSERNPEHVVFEVGEQDDLLQRARSYDARSGAPSGGRERKVGTLAIEAAGKRSEVLLRPRLRDAAFDAWLDQTARSLAQGNPGAELTPSEAGARGFERALTLYRDVSARFEPARLALASLDEHDGATVATLVLERPKLNHVPNPLASFRFELARSGSPEQARLTTARLLDTLDARKSLECAEASADLVDRAKRAVSTKKPATGECNLLGLLLPGTCEQHDDAFIENALRIRTRCVQSAHDETRVQAAPAVPDDFQLTLRRGRTGTSLDHGPRYVLALFGNGRVVFHGRHWVQSTGRNDGRTSQPMLRALLARCRSLDWFDRRGGSWNPEGCDPSDELGDVITLHAGERQRMVLDREGCRGPFSGDELAGLRALIEQVAGVSGWLEPRTDEADPKLSEWDVSAD